MRGRFCVTYEAPPYLLRLLDGWGCTWLDVRLHPVRFLDDLLFAVRASQPDTQGAVARQRAAGKPADGRTAGLREAMGQLISDATVPEDTLVVVGQRPIDATQIVDGGFFERAGHQVEIAAHLRGPRRGAAEATPERRPPQPADGRRRRAGRACWA